MIRNPLSRCSLAVVPFLLGLGVLAGCGGRTEALPVSLEELSGRTLTFALVDVDALELPDEAGLHRLTVTFSQPAEGCTRLREGVTATFNGQPMKLEPGGIVDTGREVCEEPRVWIDFDPEIWDAEPIEDGRVFLQEGEGEPTVSLIVKNLKAKRRFVYQGPGSGATLRRGQTYAYHWQPGEETPGPIIATLLREEGRAPATLNVTQEGGAVSFTLPEATPVATHLLTLSASVAGEVLECEGVAVCEGTLYHSSDFEVAVAP